MANLPGSIKNLNTLLGEQLLEGENSGGGGDGDVSTATVTVVNDCSFTIGFNSAIKSEADRMNPARSTYNKEIRRSSEPQTLNVFLYNGRAESYVYSDNGSVKIKTCEGDAELLTSNAALITGDCTLTIDVDEQN